MVSIERVEKGIANYMDTELMTKLPANGWERVVIGAAIGIAVKRSERVVNALRDNAIARALGVLTEDGSVDVDVLKDAAMEQVKKQGFAEIGGIPIIKKITFRAEDVEKLYQCIMEV